MTYKESPEGQTHYLNDGCGEPAHNYELKLCKKCGQMTNHLLDICQKHKPKTPTYNTIIKEEKKVRKPWHRTQRHLDKCMPEEIKVNGVMYKKI